MRVFKYLFILSIVFISMLGFWAHGHEHGYFWEEIPFFDTLFGFIGCIVIIIFSKALGHLWLQKKEDYYD
ncbi:MAG: hypothetical protein LWW94_00065 [Candidatus Desulfofervidaceae bacterium]|nr:hypothetical protein [Candidatus Desulfofervidaceae bacterium]